MNEMIERLVNPKHSPGRVSAEMSWTDEHGTTLAIYSTRDQVDEIKAVLGKKVAEVAGNLSPSTGGTARDVMVLVKIRPRGVDQHDREYARAERKLAYKVINQLEDAGFEVDRWGEL